MAEITAVSLEKLTKAEQLRVLHEQIDFVNKTGKRWDESKTTRYEVFRGICIDNMSNAEIESLIKDIDSNKYASVADAAGKMVSRAFDKHMGRQSEAEHYTPTSKKFEEDEIRITKQEPQNRVILTLGKSQKALKLAAFGSPDAIQKVVVVTSLMIKANRGRSLVIQPSNGESLVKMHEGDVFVSDGKGGYRIDADEFNSTYTLDPAQIKAHEDELAKKDAATRATQMAATTQADFEKEFD